MWGSCFFFFFLPLSPDVMQMKKKDAGRDGKRELGVQTTTYFFGSTLDLGLIVLC